MKTASMSILRLLYIEDEVEVANALRRALAERDTLVDVAHTMADAQAKLTTQSYHAIVLDLTLPCVQGIESVRAVRRVSALPLVVLTGWSEPDDALAQQAIELGANAWIEKPACPDVVLRTVRLEITRERILRIRRTA